MATAAAPSGSQHAARRCCSEEVTNRCGIRARSARARSSAAVRAADMLGGRPICARDSRAAQCGQGGGSPLY
eukprot:2542613-Prymnesium_polylepis.1